MRRIVLDTNCLLQSLPSNSPYRTTYYQDAYYHFGLITEDADDNKFVDCAIAANAELIVANDKHFNVLKTLDWPKLLILGIKEFASQI